MSTPPDTLTPAIEFEAFPKIPRLNRGMVITEKIDGTNAAVIIETDGEGHYKIGAQSRKRLITPDDDNVGFARWVHDNAEALAATLGPGRHFGEWWGAGIQRRYGLAEKRFSLFNTSRWHADDLAGVPQLGVVPVLDAGNFSHDSITEAVENLAITGSHAAPGFMDPEGVVVYLSAARQFFKVTVKADNAPKGLTP